MEQSTPDLILFLGRFHPVVLHFPIGLFAALFMLEAYALRRRSKDIAPALWILLSFTFLSATTAAALGIFLSWGSQYDETTLFWHKWLGISVAAGAALLLVLRLASRRGKRKGVMRCYRAALIACVVILTLGSHQGASLTHGANYLTHYMPDWLRGAQTTAESAPVAHGVFEQEILPILEARCFECHGESKQEGGLRLTSRGAALAGGKSGHPVIVPGDAMASRIVKRMTLPSDHGQVMPPAGQPRVSPPDVITIIDWVNRGARWFNKLERLQQQVPPAPDEELERLRGDGFTVRPLVDGGPLLRVDFKDASNDEESGVLTELQAIAPLVTWLDLSGRTLGEEETAQLAAFENLTRLYLQKTNITDSGLAFLTGLQYLEYLNLHNTQVSDEGLRHLEGLESLESLYVWETQVSSEGAERLHESLPGLSADLGWVASLPSEATETEQ